MSEQQNNTNSGKLFDARIRGWKEKLFDLSGHNQLLNFSDKKAVRLDDSYAAASEKTEGFEKTFAHLITGTNDYTFFSATKYMSESELAKSKKAGVAEVQIDETGKLLKNIRAKGKTFEEEQGVNAVFLTFGLLSWDEPAAGGFGNRIAAASSDDDADSAASSSKSASRTSSPKTVKTVRRSAPILIVPGKISAASMRAPYHVAAGDSDPDLFLNPTLRYYFEQIAGVQIPESTDEDEESAETVLKYFEKVKDVLSAVEGTSLNCAIEPCVHLTLLHYLKINMCNDLENNKELIAKNPNVLAVCGEPVDDPRFVIGENKEICHDSVSTSGSINVVDADSSQLDAIELVNAGKSFVLQGPPGTGKSQTIANVIANALYQGKKILFVSEKIAALDVVYNRLKKIGLGDFCLRLHDFKQNKKDFCDDLKNVLEMGLTNYTNEAGNLMIRLQSERDMLNGYVANVHDPLPKINRSLFSLFGDMASLDFAEVPDADIGLSHIESVDEEWYKSRLSVLEGITVLLRNQDGTCRTLAEEADNKAWFGTSLDAPGIESRKKLEAALKNADFDAGAAAEFAELNAIEGDPSKNTVDEAIAVISKLENNPGCLPCDLSLAANGSESQVKQLSDGCLSFAKSLEAGRGCLDKLAVLAEGITSGIKVCGISAPCSIPSKDAFKPGCSLEHLSSALLKVIDSSSALKLWASQHHGETGDPIGDPELSELLGKIRQRNETKAKIDAKYEREIYSIDVNGLYFKFKNDYADTMGRMMSFLQIGKDRKAVTQYLLAKKDMSDEEILQDLSLLRTVSLLAEEINKTPASLAANLADLYKGADTDLAKVESCRALFMDIREAQSLIDSLNGAVVSEETESLLKKNLGALYRGETTDPAALRAYAEAASVLAAFSESSSKTAPGFADAIAGAAAGGLEKISLLKKECSEASSKLGGIISFFAGCFSEQRAAAIASMGPKALRSFANKCLADLDDLSAVQARLSAELAEARKCGLGQFIDDASRQNMKTEIMPLAFKKAFAAAYADYAMPRLPQIKNFSRIELDSVVADFCHADEEKIMVDRARVRQKLTSMLPSEGEKMRDNEIKLLLKECGKKRKQMPIRTLMGKIPNLLKRLKPCFMMSPLSVSVFLEADAFKEFDLVVFDEASQIRVEDAIGAIYRGKQILITGDSRQLPPTNFFKAETGSDEYDENESDDDAYESILDRAGSMPQHVLKWHYRSKHEHLIAFSNVHIYGSDLVTFPSSIQDAKDRGVEFVFVEDGLYENRENKPEAKRVAEEVIGAYERHPEQSVGVIAFSEKQADCIKTALDKILDEKPDLLKYFGEDGGPSGEPFFIKSIESVQGDERDTIVFSIGYGKDKAGKFAHLFGPLSKEGGERRLNVAVTRAKRNIKLVSSVKCEDFDERRMSSEGPKLLKKYVEFAQRGIASLESKLKAGAANLESSFEDTVAKFLENNGYAVKRMVGCSGLRVDIAVVDPKDQGSFILGVRCDGGMYKKARTARERERTMNSVLKSNGWRIWKVWSTDWIKNPNRAKQELLEAVRSAAAGEPEKEVKPLSKTFAAGASQPAQTAEQPAAQPMTPFGNMGGMGGMAALAALGGIAGIDFGMGAVMGGAGGAAEAMGAETTAGLNAAGFNPGALAMAALAQQASDKTSERMQEDAAAASSSNAYEKNVQAEVRLEDIDISAYYGFEKYIEGDFNDKCYVSDCVKEVVNGGEFPISPRHLAYRIAKSHVGGGKDAPSIELKDKVGKAFDLPVVKKKILYQNGFVYEAGFVFNPANPNIKPRTVGSRTLQMYSPEELMAGFALLVAKNPGFADKKSICEELLKALRAPAKQNAADMDWVERALDRAVECGMLAYSEEKGYVKG